jgi:hypothetical protein
MKRNQLAGATILAALAVLLSAALPARAADEGVPSFKNRGNEEKRFVARVAEAIVHAAHPTAKKVGLVKYEFTNPKPNRTELTLKAEYYGKVTNKRYVADIVVKIDSADKNAWEVLNIEYTDSNTIKHSEQKVQDLIKDLNKK